MLKRSLSAFILLVGIAGCNNNEPSSPNYGESGGASTSSTGGNAGSGGHSNSGGSSGSAGSGGGTTSAGGSVASGGTAGGSTGTGGTATASGGAATGTGGAGSGGLVGHGGTIGSGGAVASGGSASSGSGGGTSASSGGAGGSSSAVSYSKQIAPLLKSNCTSCHSGSFASSGVDLSTYAGAKANASAASGAIQVGRMPPSGPLSATNKQLFQSWVTEGALDN